MSYKIEKAGYKFKGYELSQKVMYQGSEATIIGFDERHGMLFPIVVASSYGNEDIRLDRGITTVLDVAHENNQRYEWASINEIATIIEKEKPMEKKMTKADLEGKWVKVTKGDDRNFKTGDVLSIKNRQIRSKNNLEGLYSWFNELPEEFTLSELNKVLSTSYQATSLVYFDKTPQPQSKPNSDSPNPNKKSDKTNLTVKLNVDMLFNKPVVEETEHEVYIFSGRTTVFIDKEMGIYGVATVNSNELNTYCKETGKAIAFYRAYNK